MRLLGIPELMLVLLLALLVFGPNLGRTLRSAVTEFHLTAVQKVLASISIIVLAVVLGLLLANGFGR